MDATETLSRSGPDSLEIISEALSLSCISILSVALGAKSKDQRLSTMTYGRALVLFLYILSWTFCAMSMVTVSTNNHNIVSCTLGILICDVFYAGSKITIYAWLIERVHLATAMRSTRWQSIRYRIHIGMLSPYIGIFILMLIYRNNYLLDDGKCIIGLQPISSIPLMCYDFLLNLYLTFLFVRPLVSSRRNPVNNDAWKKSRLYKLTRRTVVSSGVCLTVSLVNILILAIFSGRERGLVCLTMCTVDVTINVITIHWVTSGRVKMSVRRNASLPSRQSTSNTIHYDENIVHDYLKTSTTQNDDHETASARSIQMSHSSVKPIQAQ